MKELATHHPMPMVMLGFALFFEVYTLLLQMVCFIKKRFMSGFSIPAGIFFLVGLLYGLAHAMVSVSTFLILLILLALLMYFHWRVSRYFQRKYRKGSP